MKSLMKAKKMGRFADGGEVDGNDLGAYNEAGSGSSDSGSDSGSRDSPAAEPSSFKDAFASARKGGAKTFEWKGKKYTTEMASAKPPVQRVEITAKRPSLSQGLGEKFAAVDRAHRTMPEGTSPTAREALTKMRDSAKAAYEKAADSERTGKSVVKLANGGVVRRQTAKSHGKAC